MHSSSKKLIGVISSLRPERINGLCHALAKVFPVTFESRRRNELDGLDAVVLLDAGLEAAQHLYSLRLNCYVEARSNSPAIHASECHFQTGSETPRVLRGRTMQIRNPVEAVPVLSFPGLETVASADACPVWQQKSDEKARLCFVSTKLAELEKNECLADQLNTLPGVLPLIDFLRFVTGYFKWRRPPFRACLMFDDPNLHWKTYGHIDYQKLVRHAEEHNYHAAMATIPLDAWLVHSVTARLFRENSRSLSLLVHGNDHLHRELARDYSDEERSQLVAQALIRIALLERKAGVEVARLMAAPHGACTEEMMKYLRFGGFEGACISYGSLRSANRVAPWVDSMGAQMAECINGLPVMPRFRLERGCLSRILLAAYLDQPIIPVGHHQEARDGMELLAEIASVINSLGEVQWTNVKDLSRSNYLMQRDNNLLRIRMYSRRIVLTAPEDVEELLIERTLVNADDEENLEIRLHGLASLKAECGQPLPVTLSAGQRIELIVRGQAFAPEKKSMGAVGLWPFVRRQMAECRDRLVPLLHKR